MENKNNPNCGGVGDSAISKIVPEPVSVTSADQKPYNPPLGGSKFVAGEPAGREAKPRPVAKGHKDVRIGS